MTRVLPLLLLLLPSLASAAPFPGADAITVEAVKASVGYLASDALEGRGSGAKGGLVAGAWLAEQCQALGLQPGGDQGTFFQGFEGQGQTMRNVVATIPGREQGEMVVIGAHYDHLGMGHQMGSLAFGDGKGKVHNGADDNASGTAAIFEIARAFKASGEQPRHRMVFVWFDGEERGLLGSQKFVSSPLFTDACSLMINLDMVGRLKSSLPIYGATTGGDVLKGWMEVAGQGLNLELHLREIVNSNSDHASFYKQKVPVIVPFTGLHGDYHRPSDDADVLNYEGIVEIAKFSYGVAYQAANAQQRAPFVKARDGTLEAMLEQLQAMFGGDGDGKGPDLSKLFGGGDGKGPDLSKLFGGDGKGPDLSKLGEQLKTLFGGRGERGEHARQSLGVVIDRGEGAPRVGKVQPNTIAERAGIEAGDVIVTWGGVQVDSFDTLRGFIQKARGQVDLEVERGGERIGLTAEFQGEAPRPQRRVERTERKPANPKVPAGPRWF